MMTVTTAAYPLILQVPQRTGWVVPRYLCTGVPFWIFKPYSFMRGVSAKNAPFLTPAFTKPRQSPLFGVSAQQHTVKQEIFANSELRQFRENFLHANCKSL